MIPGDPGQLTGWRVVEVVVVRHGAVRIPVYQGIIDRQEFQVVIHVKGLLQTTPPLGRIGGTGAVIECRNKRFYVSVIGIGLIVFYLKLAFYLYEQYRTLH